MSSTVDNLLQFYEDRVTYDFPLYKNKLPNTFQMIDFHKSLCEDFVKTLNNTRENTTCELICYLKRVFSAPKIISKKLKDRGYAVPFYIYQLYADNVGLPRDSIYFAVSNSISKSIMSMPFKIQLKKISQDSAYQIFSIIEIEQSILKTNKIFDRPVSLSRIRKDFSEVMRSFSTSGIDTYILDSIIAGFIATHPHQNKIGGLGALYPKNVEIKNDLIKLKEALNFVGVPFSHLGNFVYLDGSVQNFLIKRQTLIGKARNLSWNMPYSGVSSLLSEFKYDAPFLCGCETTDLKNNLGLKFSMCEYAIRNGTIHNTDKLYGKLLQVVQNKLNELDFFNKRNNFEKIIIPEEIPNYVYNVSSFYSKFGLSENELVNQIKKWVDGNLILFGESIEASKLKNITMRGIDSRAYFLLGQTDRTQEGFIEILAEQGIYSYKLAKITLQQLINSGLILQRQGKLFWYGEF